MTTNDKDQALRLASIEPEEYDALADLFLGESVLAPDPAPESSHLQDDEFVAVVVDDDLYEEGQAVDLPCPPERYIEKEEAKVIEPEKPLLSGAESVLEEFAAIAPVQVIGRIAPDDDSDEVTVEHFLNQKSIVSVGPQVEVVLLGHLPVRATLWVRQYACSVARETGETVALIRAAAGSTAVDLITGEMSIDTKQAVSIEHALEKVMHLADRVILRVDEAGEPELLEREEIDQVTILTGADETAVVASYRLIKTLTASWDWDQEDSPMLRMAVMGGSSEQSADARSKLTRAVESFLDHPIEIVISAGRIDATGTMNLFREDVAHPAGHILDGLSGIGGAAELGEPVDRRSPIEVLREDIDALETLDAITQHVRVEAEHGERDEPALEARGSVVHSYGHTLSGLIPGLSAMETRCPSAPGVELARDESGRVHLVTEDRSVDALALLTNAEQWARDHLQLLLRVEPGLTMPSNDPRDDTDPTLHLLASEPRALMALYPTSVRVYALAKVQVGDAMARVATPIN